MNEKLENFIKRECLGDRDECHDLGYEILEAILKDAYKRIDEDMKRGIQKYIDEESNELAEMKFNKILIGSDNDLQKLFGHRLTSTPHFDAERFKYKGWHLLSKLIEANPKFFVNAKIEQQAKEIESLRKENRSLNACIDRISPLSSATNFK